MKLSFKNLSKHSKAVVGFAFLLLLNSCSQESKLTFEEKVDNSMREYFAKKIDDPKSFEFVEITDVDTITFKEHLEREILINSIPLENKEESLKQEDRLENLYHQILQYKPNDAVSKEGLENVNIRRLNIKKYQLRVDSLTALLNSPNKDNIEFIELYYNFRMNNSSGIKNLYRYYVKLNDDLTVKSVSEEKKEN